MSLSRTSTSYKKKSEIIQENERKGKIDKFDLQQTFQCSYSTNCGSLGETYLALSQMGRKGTPCCFLVLSHATRFHMTTPHDWLGSAVARLQKTIVKRPHHQITPATSSPRHVVFAPGSATPPRAAPLGSGGKGPWRTAEPVDVPSEAGTRRGSRKV